MTNSDEMELRPLEVVFWGDFACFTRPEMKAERVSYPIMTPSAARGALESIFWKPEFTWRVEEIQVLKPIKYFSILRNEVNSRAIYRTASGWSKSGAGGYFAQNDRSQRHTLALRDVAYLVKAQVVVKHGIDADPAKYRDQFRRRVQNGRCFAMPYLGCREFTASFTPPSGSERPIDLSDNIGTMLLDIRYKADGSGGTPLFFDARLECGALHVPIIPELEAD